MTTSNPLETRIAATNKYLWVRREATPETLGSLPAGGDSVDDRCTLIGGSASFDVGVIGRQFETVTGRAQRCGGRR